MMAVFFLHAYSSTAKMASKFLQIHVQTSTTPKSSLADNINLARPGISFSYAFNKLHQELLQIKAGPKIRPRTLSTNCSSSSLSYPKPPTTKEEAIDQAKTSLSSALEKPLNNPKLAGKIKKPKQPRLRVEIPIVDDAPSSLCTLAAEVLGRMSIRRKGPSQIKILMIWPGQSLTETAVEAFESQSSDIVVQNISISSSALTKDIVRNFISSDVVTFVAPEASQLATVKRVTDSLYPKPTILFNPKWSYEEEESFGDMSGFVGSFEVVYSFAGLEVRGILSKRKGVIFKCVRDGVLSGEKWNVFVEEEGGGEGELKVVSRFKARPTIVEVENVLYNLMAANSPVTKSAKFLKDLVSNVTGNGRRMKN